MEERLRFVMDFQDEEESMSQLCRQYGISRRVGYKWLSRYEEFGLEGLKEQSRAPHDHPNEVAERMRQRIVQLRGSHPRWGPRKLRALLEREGCAGVPASSTIGEILRREGLSVRRHRRRRSATSSVPGGCTAANRVWCADFKGWFKTADGRRCDPLTISDGYSRYLLRCQVVRDTGYAAVRRVFEATFREYGMPESIRSDNGVPFASTGVGGLSRLSVWWVRLGIVPQRIEPGHPEQNGRHERMHLTLKQETASPPARTLGRQQDRFDEFRRQFNQERPHEALSMCTPQSFYELSARAYPERLSELEYPSEWVLRKVAERGQFRWKRWKVMLGKALQDEVIGLEALCPRYWRTWFGPMDLGIFDEQRSRMLSEAERCRRGL